MHHHSGLGLLTPFDVHHGLAEIRLAERAAVLQQAFAATPERFARGMSAPPALPQAVWINRPRTLEEHARAPMEVEPGERVARPTVWRSAPAGRSLDREMPFSLPASTEEVELAAAH